MKWGERGNFLNAFVFLLLRLEFLEGVDVDLEVCGVEG